MIRYLPLLLLAGCASKPPAPAVVAPEVPVVETHSPRPERVPKQPVRNIFFDVDVDALKPGQLRALTAFRNWHDRVGGGFTCTGYADTTGPEDFNAAMSLRRAEAVAAKIGCVPVAGGETTMFGEDGYNRRVVITVTTKE